MQRQAPERVQLSDHIQVLGLPFQKEAPQRGEPGQRRQGQPLLSLPQAQVSEIRRQVVQAVEAGQTVVERVRLERVKVRKEPQEVQICDAAVVGPVARNVTAG